MTDTPIPPQRLKAIIGFLQSAERLKDTLRSGYTSQGRRESTAEHSWRLCLMAMTFEKDLPGIDFARLLKLCIVHDLGEAISGDTPATRQQPDDGREARERADMAALCASLPDDLRSEMLELWEEYTSCLTPEAALAKGFDKLETMMQHLIGSNGSDIDYAFNLAYGVEQTARHALLRQIRVEVDAATRQRVGQAPLPNAK